MRLGFLRFFFHPRFFLKAQEKKKKRLPKGPRHGGEQHLTAGAAGGGGGRGADDAAVGVSLDPRIGGRAKARTSRVHSASLRFRDDETNETTPPRAMVWGCVPCAPISLSLSFSAVVYSKAYCFARFRFVNRSLSRTYDTAEGK
ncbi:hypothetical protein C4D60_Mb04t11200 [Musa balbisiana]|uniref:Uncharacterized protein n=1 Tax=Musa balbisiana TaxID=52838 RepID=A0A4S8KB99_MUSBA|nr:hypothetical protein C4D60_Mb04t11200 [Musa balbisiana]